MTLNFSQKQVIYTTSLNWLPIRDNPSLLDILNSSLGTVGLNFLISIHKLGLKWLTIPFTRRKWFNLYHISMVPDSGIQKKFSFFAVLVFSGYEHKDLLKNNPRVQDKWILSSFNKRWRYNFWWRYHRTFNHGYNLADCFFNPSGLSGKIKSI